MVFVYFLEKLRQLNIKITILSRDRGGCLLLLNTEKSFFALFENYKQLSDQTYLENK
jgi:hypothetical protein